MIQKDYELTAVVSVAISLVHVGTGTDFAFSGRTRRITPSCSHLLSAATRLGAAVPGRPAGPAAVDVCPVII